MKHVMGAYNPSWLHFIAVSTVTFFFINHVLNCQERCDTHFMYNINSPSLLRFSMMVPFSAVLVILCNGFAYTCPECNFYLDIKCSVFLDQSVMNLKNTSCVSTCCAMLPTIVRHRNHKHLRVLRYSPIEGEVEDPDQCICDICEYFRNPMHWFYCAECNFTAHLDCAGDPWKYIKLGGTTYEYEPHPHPLALAKMTRIHCDDLCEICGDPCKAMTFQCAECKFNVDWNFDTKLFI
ncbi:hypothetical protein LOK49_LG03G01730 [Camellia lanceoleosa]|uniref:Uncharacterized protein n=1 Tax=Camellia lanceoleosa TaxID=1840588 RepID=A0ACC0IFF8_9ERIC|nr:hypothetical protein LOK49_LG03G01730 [Camellia lanceoleosa]